MGLTVNWIYVVFKNKMSLESLNWNWQIIFKRVDNNSVEDEHCHYTIPNNKKAAMTGEILKFLNSQSSKATFEGLQKNIPKRISVVANEVPTYMMRCHKIHNIMKASIKLWTCYSCGFCNLLEVVSKPGLTCFKFISL